jgi:hypothetical protein
MIPISISELQIYVSPQRKGALSFNLNISLIPFSHYNDIQINLSNVKHMLASIQPLDFLKEK